jgi:hypothetical protein
MPRPPSLALVLVFVLAVALGVAACPPAPPPVLPPECGVTSVGDVGEAEQAISFVALPSPSIQIVLEGGDVCTPGTAGGCAESFDACDINVGDVAVADVRRETVFVRAVNAPLTLFDARIEGSCADVYIEGFTGFSFVNTGATLPVTIVVNATSTEACGARLVIESDAVNAAAQTISMDIVVNRVPGGAEGCSTAVACCCDFTGARFQARCGDDERLSCVNPDAQLLFTEQCTLTCGAPVSSSWITSFGDDPLMVGPAPLDGGDFAVLHAAPCTVARYGAEGELRWSRTLQALEVCDDIAFAGVVLVVAGDGRVVLVDALTGVEGATRENEGATSAAPVPAQDGALLASRRDDDIVVRRTNSIGADMSSFELLAVAPDLSQRHAVAALANGDAVLSFVRAVGAGSVDLPSVNGGVFTLGDADYTALLQVDGAGLVRRAFVMQSSIASNVAARNNAYVMCGGTVDAGTLVELGEAGSPAVAMGDFAASRAFTVVVDGDVVSLELDPQSNLAAACGFESNDAPFSVTTSNTSFTLRREGLVSELMNGRAVAMGAFVDAQDVVVVGVHGGIAGQELLPLYPPGTTPLESGSFVLRVPLVEFLP